jgi:hypothetical protein
MGNDLSCCNADGGSAAPIPACKMRLDQPELDLRPEPEEIQPKPPPQQQQQRRRQQPPQQQQSAPDLEPAVSQRLRREQQQVNETEGQSAETVILAEAARRKVAIEVERSQHQRSIGLNCAGRQCCSSKPRREQ